MIATLLTLCFCACQSSQPAPLESPHTLAKAGKIDAATAAWKAWIARHPKDADYRVGLVKHLFANNRLNDALDACQEALNVFPKHYDLLYLMARLSQAKGELLAKTQGGRATAAMYFEDVVQFAGEATALAPTKREPRALRGMSLFGLGRTAEAKLEARELVRRFPKHPGGWILLGECLFDAYQVAKQKGGTAGLKRAAELAPEIKKTFEKAAALDAARVVPWRRLGDIAAWEGLYARALTFYAEALARNPKRGAPLTWIAENTKPEQRIAAFETAIRRFAELGTKPESAAADLHWQLGYVQFAEQHWKAARREMQICYGLRDDYVNALFYYGLSSYQLGDEDAALIAFGMFAQKSATDLAKAIRDSGVNRDANLNLVVHFADLAHKRDNLPMSRDLNHAVALADASAQRWNNYAFLCRETAQFVESYRAYKKALELAPGDPQLLNDCAVIQQYHLRTDLAEARDMYNRAIKIAKQKTRDPKVPRADKDRFRQALADARGNLLKLKREKQDKKD